MKNPAIRYALAAAALLAVLALQFAGVFADDEGTQAQEPTPQPSPAVTVSPESPDDGPDGPATSTEAPEDVVPDFDEQVAAQAAAARSTWSWTDRESLSWASRLAEVSTSNYADQLEELPTTSVDEAEWAHGVVEPEASSRVTNVRVKLLDGSSTSGTVDLRVSYDVEVSYGKPELIDSHGGHGEPDTVETGPAPEVGQWVPLYEQDINMRFVFEGDRWLVDAISYPAS